MRFQDRVVWITGATSGIGEQLAHAFHAEGARLVLSARRADALARVAEACGAPDRARAVALDLSEHASLEERVAAARECFGPCDVLVHNAGVSQRATALETDWVVDKHLIDVNYLGPVVLTKVVLPEMVQRGAGHIVVVSSVAGKMGVPGRSGYSGSKFALQGFFEALRAEVGSAGVKVTLVFPGYVHTELSVNALTGDGSPQGRMDSLTAGGFTPEDCARRIVDATHRGRREVVIAGPRERLAVYLQRFAPWLLARIIVNAQVT
jgi:short-subunit dehydrogenase